MKDKDYSSIHHTFDINVAVKLGGPDLAIFFHHIHYWLEYNQRMGINLHDGKYWTYQTLQEIHAHFPYWTLKQLRLIIEKLIEMGILLKGNYNTNKYDHTLWYSIDYEKVKSICPKGQIENAERANRSSQKGKSITHNIPNNKNNVVVVDARENARVISSETQFTKSDLYAISVGLRKDWSTAEIEEAWRRYEKIHPDGVSSPFDYIEGIINKIRVMSENKEKREEICKKNKMLEKKTKGSNKESKNLEEKILTPDTKSLPFQNWKFQP